MPIKRMAIVSWLQRPVQIQRSFAHVWLIGEPSSCFDCQGAAVGALKARVHIGSGTIVVIMC